MDMNTLRILFQRKSLQTLFNDKVKGLVEDLLSVNESGRFVLIFAPFFYSTSFVLYFFPKHAACRVPFIS